jgi:serine protease DegQ
MWTRRLEAENRGMSTQTLTEISEQLADAVAGVAASVVQVHGRRRPVSGVAYANNIVLTTARALGREDGVTVRTADGQTGQAQLLGWDPASGLAVLEVEGLALTPAERSVSTPRVGQIVLGVARSWSNALTASSGIIAVIGGPLRTGRGQSLEQVIRVTAPMHEGFSGGAVVDASGKVIGIGTAAQIRGLGVVIPGGIVWKSAAYVLEHGRPKAGFLGLSGQPVALPEGQRGDTGRDRGLLVVGLSDKGPAHAAGVLIGDIVLDIDGHPVGSTDDVLGLLTGERVGRAIPVRLLRGGGVVTLPVTVAERPAS